MIIRTDNNDDAMPIQGQPIAVNIIINVTIHDVNAKDKEWVQRARARDEGKTEDKGYWQKLIKKDDDKQQGKTMATNADIRIAEQWSLKGQECHDNNELCYIHSAHC